MEGRGRTEDDFAFLRADNEYQNLLLLEQPNGHFGDTIVRLVLFDSFYVLQLEGLLRCSDVRLAEIAARAIKEVRYHLRHVSQWLIRLGDGTDESHDRARQAVQDLWRFTDEFFAGDDVDDCIRDVWAGPDLAKIRDTWHSNVANLLATATLEMPDDVSMVSGGRQGSHTEHMGHLIAEMQQLQRSYPGVNW
jgi:ring-1,2-phenylacetyl-CoA epoxidase subunit PaaC